MDAGEDVESEITGTRESDSWMIEDEEEEIVGVGGGRDDEDDNDNELLEEDDQQSIQGSIDSAIDEGQDGNVDVTKV